MLLGVSRAVGEGIEAELDMQRQHAAGALTLAPRPCYFFLDGCAGPPASPYAAFRPRYSGDKTWGMREEVHLLSRQFLPKLIENPDHMTIYARIYDVW